MSGPRWNARGTGARQAVVVAVGAVLLVTGILVTAGSAGAVVVRPVISGLAASPSTLPDVGGIASVSATVSGGSTCTWSAKPTLTGLPASTPCTSGTVTQSVDIPGGKAKKFTVTLTVQGPTASRRANVKIVETKALPNPTVTSINPSSGPERGSEAITVTGTNLSTATSVTFGGNSGQVLQVLSDDSVLVSNPDWGTTGTADTQIILAGNETSPTTPGDVFTYVDGPAQFPATIIGTASGVSTVDDHGPGNPETTWSGTVTFTWDPGCSENPVGLISNQQAAACYTGTFSGTGSHNWYGYGIDGPGDTPVCASPLNFTLSSPTVPIGADIQIDSEGNYHFYFSFDQGLDFPPPCTNNEDISSSEPLVGFEHDLSGDTMTPDSYQFGQDTGSESGQDAGGDGPQMTTNGIAGAGWSGTIDWTFDYS
jgi:hypothetical protein